MRQQALAWWKNATQLAIAARNEPERCAHFVGQLAARDPHVSVPAIWALQQVGPVAIPALLAGLRHPHPRIRRGCVDIIDHGGYGADERCVDALLALLHDEVPHIRRAVWHTLFCERCPDMTKCQVIGRQPLDQVALLIEVGIRDPNPKLRRQLTEDLRTHVNDPRAQAVLAKLAETGIEA